MGVSPIQPGCAAAPATETLSLLALVEAAEGPDRALDDAIHEHLFPRREEEVTLEDGSTLTLPAGWGSGFDPPYTSSLDAALALCERFFPGAQAAIYTGWPLKRHGTETSPGSWSIPSSAPRGCWVSFYGGEYLGPLYNACCEAANPALALTGAVLHALILQARMDTADEPLSHRQARAEWKRRMAQPDDGKRV